MCNVITRTSTMMCYVCGIKNSEMNNLALIKEKPEAESTFRYEFQLYLSKLT